MENNLRNYQKKFLKQEIKKKLALSKIKLTLLQHRTYIPGPIFYLYRVFFSLVQMRPFVAGEEEKAPTRPREGTFVPGSGNNRYECLTFVPVGGSTQYKCGHIYIGGR
jgi:hypothetical protein